MGRKTESPDIAGPCGYHQSVMEQVMLPAQRGASRQLKLIFHSVPIHPRIEGGAFSAHTGKTIKPFPANILLQYPSIEKGFASIVLTNPFLLLTVLCHPDGWHSFRCYSISTVPTQNSLPVTTPTSFSPGSNLPKILGGITIKAYSTPGLCVRNLITIGISSMDTAV